MLGIESTFSHFSDGGLRLVVVLTRLILLLFQDPLLILQVLEQPIEYLDVAVHRYLDIIDVLAFLQVRPEVQHILPEMILVAVEVAADLPVLVENVDHQQRIV